MYNPYTIVREFETALCEYTGAKYAVTVTSCTMAILLSLLWVFRAREAEWKKSVLLRQKEGDYRPTQAPSKDVEIPNKTYISVPHCIFHAGGRVKFRNEDWDGWYQLSPLSVWDSARRFTSGMFEASKFICVSFHHTKILGLAGHGGAILHDDPDADPWLRKMRFDGRTEGVPPKDDLITEVGYHCYMTPTVAAEGLLRLQTLPMNNQDLPKDEYPDLSQLMITWMTTKV